jgi:hypothetical protein
MGIRGRNISKRQAKLETAKARPTLYKKARDKLRKLINSGAEPDDFYPALSGTTITRIYEGKKPVGDIQKDRLIELLAGGVSSYAYKAIADSIGQPRETRGIVDKLSGNYCYFRCDTPPIAGKRQLSEGRIRIRPEKNGDIAFDHWSPDWADETTPEHVGYAFLVSNKLFMLAWRPSVLRLGIAHCAGDGKGVMSGFVLSVRSGDNNPIFSAASILVRDDNTKLLDKLRSANAIEEFEKHHSAHQVGYMVA